jgi:hypothetical protein
MGDLRSVASVSVAVFICATTACSDGGMSKGQSDMVPLYSVSPAEGQVAVPPEGVEFDTVLNEDSSSLMMVWTFSNDDGDFDRAEGVTFVVVPYDSQYDRASLDLSVTSSTTGNESTASWHLVLESS